MMMGRTVRMTNSPGTNRPETNSPQSKNTPTIIGDPDIQNPRYPKLLKSISGYVLESIS